MAFLLGVRPAVMAGSCAARSLATVAGRVAISRAPKRQAKAAIDVTEAAAMRLRDLIAGKPDALGVRLGVKTRGCNGVSYTMNYATSKGKFDEEVLIPTSPGAGGGGGASGPVVAAAPAAGSAAPSTAAASAPAPGAPGAPGAAAGAPGAAGAPAAGASAGAGSGGAAAAAGAAGGGSLPPGVVRVFIEPSALLKIAGTTMDWKEDDVSAEFVFSNPNAKAVCGCGESFSS